MGTFKIEGGHVLKGEIVPQGAKNEALQVICATLLTEESVKISNVPNILDVNKLIDLLIAMGVKVTRHGNGVYTFKADAVNLDYLESDAFRADGAALRGSIMILGPLLARFGKVFMPKPGGDKIGRRRLDTHFIGFQKLGAKFNYSFEENFYSLEAEKLEGTYIHLEEASVTGTANIIMAAVKAKGDLARYD